MDYSKHLYLFNSCEITIKRSNTVRWIHITRTMQLSVAYIRYQKWYESWCHMPHFDGKMGLKDQYSQWKAATWHIYTTTCPMIKGLLWYKIQYIHVFRCPVYVLDPILQAGKKLPCWQPRSRKELCVGFSHIHSSDVPLVQHPQIGSIYPWYHVVFDDTILALPLASLTTSTATTKV